MIKAVIIGFAHMHVNEVALYIHQEPSMELCACADVESNYKEILKAPYTREWNKDNVCEKYCDRYYEDYLLMLDEVKPDIAFILCENHQKAEIVEECAKRKINISIEKPMAISLQEALKIQRSVKLYGIEAVINWPITWRPYLHQIKLALSQGLIGEVIKVRYLIGNTGAVGKGAKHRGVSEKSVEMTDLQKSKMWWYHKKPGGGALLDFCCYGCILSQWFFQNDALSAMAVGCNLATSFSDIYDNAAALVKYPNAMAVLEGTWTTPSRGIPAGPTIFGTDGVLYCEKENDSVVVKAIDIYGEDIPVPAIDFPEYRRNMASEYAHHRLTGEPMHETLQLDFNIRAIAALDAIARSAESHKEEMVGNDTWLV